MGSSNQAKSPGGRGSRLDRRAFIAAAGGTLATSIGVGAIPFERSQAAQSKWDHEADVVVVGSGAAALSAAVVATDAGARVIVLESAPVPGGATARSGGGFWVPNNKYMRAKGIADPREDAVRYMARYSFTHLYDPAGQFYGIPENSYRLMEAMYDNAAPAVEKLESLGALFTRADDSYDYWDYAPENKAPAGRLMWATQLPNATGAPLRGGAELIRQLADWLKSRQVPILLEHRATRLVLNDKREVVGVEATTDDGEKTVTLRARRAVHFGSGGFILNPELNLNFQRGPVFGACGPMTNQGDFVYMATELGAKLGNMQNGWRFQLVLDQALQTPALATDMWGVVGDSMLLVNKYGKRVVNEKRPYSDRGEIHFVYDPCGQEWTNLVLFMVFDQRVMDLCAGRYPIPPKGAAAPYILKGDSIEALSQAISGRLAQFAPRIGGFKLHSDFARSLGESVARFNGFAQSGKDLDFQRGDYRYDGQWHTRFGGDEASKRNDKPNKTMYPLASNGPYYAVCVVSGSADTNGGPVINSKAQVLSMRNRPIAGLYGAGNCIASPSGRAYWGGGATIGLALTFGSIAGANAAKEPIKEVRASTVMRTA